MLDFLPHNFKREIFDSFPKILEIRIRKNLPVTVIGILNGELKSKSLNLKTDEKDLENIIMNLSSFSVFCVEENLKRGFITSSNGERVGVCGECVLSGKEIVTVKNVTSLCVRIPHDAIGCSDGFTKNCDSVKSCLVYSPPFQGKTTFIRDLGRTYSNRFFARVLFIDERDELSAGGKFDLGKNSDVMRYSTKSFGFYSGIRNLNPTVIICDEIMSDDDCNAIEFASLSGVKTVASCHCDKMENLLKKENISRILKKNIFDNVIEIKEGKINKIYEEKEWAKYF